MRSHIAWRIHVIILLSTTSFIEGSIKCYCNLPECQSTGYICASYSEFCFSKLYIKSESDQNGTSADVHGCVELLPENTPDSVCDGSGDAVQRTSGGLPLLYCCSDSMCNYKQNQDVSVDIVEDSTNEVFRPQEKDGQLTTESSSIITPSVSAPTTRKEDVIFKAAVVAVPIAGSLILIILIIMAVKMLREDRRNSNRSSGGFIKTQGFIQQHFNKKSQKQTSSSDKLVKPKKSAQIAVNIDDESLHPLRKPHKLLKTEKPAPIHNSLCLV